MSKNSVYQRPIYTNFPATGIRDRQRNLSISPHKTTSQRKSFLQGTIKNEDLPSTQAKRNRENDEDYIDHVSRSIHQEKTNKKLSYQKQSPLQSSTNYMNNVYQGTVSNNKLEMVKEQNLYLAQENTHLNELLVQKNKIISALEKKLEYQIQQEVITLEQIEKEKNRFLSDFHARDDEQRVQIQKLLIELQHSTQQIDRLNMEKMEILRQKDHQVEILKASYNEQNRHLIDNVISKKDIELKTLDAQLIELNEIIDQMTVELKTEKQSAKDTEKHLKDQLARVLDELQQVNHQKKIQISEQKIAFDNITLTMNKEKQQQISNVIFKYEVELKKMKNALNQQMLSNSALQNFVQTAKLEHSNEVQKRLGQQTQLKHHIHELKLFYQHKQHDELQKEKQLNFQENQMLTKAMQLKDQQYEEDLKKLILVNRQNKAEIQRLYAQIESLRNEKKEQLQRMQKINTELKERISELTTNNEEESETLKVKLGHLRHSDIITLKEYYENQLALKTQEIIDLEKSVKENRDKLHKELEEKVIQRKHHEREIDQLRIKVGELQLKIASIVEQHKERIHSMGSQIQMTSMTLIQQTTQKQKYSKQTEIQKRNLQEIITKKDEQIEQLNSKLVLVKKSHTEEISQKEQTISILHEKNQHLNDEIRRERQFYQKEIQKKEQSKKQTKEFYELEIQKQKQTYSREFTEVTERLMKQKNELLIHVQHLTLVEKQLRDELSLHAEHHQQRTLEKQVSYSEQKARLQYSKQSSEINLKNYYERKISEIQQELNTTKQQLSEKSQDVRNLSQKNYKLQRKLDKIMESQQKMRVLQEKVMALGQENNIVKNMADLAGTKSRKRVA